MDWACIEEMSNANKILVRNPEAKRQLFRYKHGRENNIKINVTEMWY
jgi:hypothetical protein